MTENTNPLNKYFRQASIYVALPSGTDYPPEVVSPSKTGEIGVMPMTARDEIKFKTPDKDRVKGLSPRWYSGVVGFVVRIGGAGGEAGGRCREKGDRERRVLQRLLRDSLCSADLACRGQSRHGLRALRACHSLRASFPHLANGQQFHSLLRLDRAVRHVAAGILVLPTLSSVVCDGARRGPLGWWLCARRHYR